MLSERGEMLGMMPSRDAMVLAQNERKDLVLVTEKSTPPVVKIIELSKYKYQLQQRNAEQRKKAKTAELKEVWFKPFMSDNDRDVRTNQVRGFLEKGNKVRLTLKFRGREIAKKEFGYELFKKVFAKTEDISAVEIVPKFVGKNLIAQLTPVKNKKVQVDHEKDQAENPQGSEQAI